MYLSIKIRNVIVDKARMKDFSRRSTLRREETQMLVYTTDKMFHPLEPVVNVSSSIHSKYGCENIIRSV